MWYVISNYEGSKPVIITNKNPKFALNIVRNTEKHIIYAVPLMLHIMGSFPLGTFQFHKIMTSGSPLPEALFYKLKNDNIYDAKNTVVLKQVVLVYVMI